MLRGIWPIYQLETQGQGEVVWKMTQSRLVLQSCTATYGMDGEHKELNDKHEMVIHQRQ